MTILILFMSSLAILPTYYAWREWRAWYYLRRYGMEIAGTVQYAWIGKIGMFDHYYLIYDFEVETSDGEYFSQYTEITRQTYQAVQAGTPPRVRYASVKPAIFRLVDQPFEYLRWTFSAGLAWVVVAFFVLIAVS